MRIDSDRPIRKSKRRLPHWQQDNATYHIDFSLWRGILTSEERNIVLDACKHWHTVRWHLYGAVVMPDHVHIVARPLAGQDGEFFPLSRLIQSVKGYSARAINKRRDTIGRLWGREYHDRLLRTERDFREKMRYLMDNAQRAGVSGILEEYEFLWYEGKVGGVPAGKSADTQDIGEPADAEIKGG